MSSKEIVNTSINRFGSAQQADCVTDTEQVFVLSSKELMSIISKAIQDATEPLYQEIAYDRQRIAKLEQKEPQPLQVDRGTMLRALLAANGGKMLSKEARQKMHLSEACFSRLLSSMKDDIEVRPFHLRKNQNVLVLKSKLLERKEKGV